jgi:ankyrin repeat protein
MSLLETNLELSMLIKCTGYRPAYQIALDSIFVNPRTRRDPSSETTKQLEQIFVNKETIQTLGFTPSHRIILGINQIDLDSHFELFAQHINSPDSSGATPLAWAAKRGDIKTLRLLLKCKARVDVEDNSGAIPLHQAVISGNDECVKALLEAGASPNARDSFGATPLHYIFRSYRGRTETIRSLVEFGADVNARTCSPLHWMMDTTAPTEVPENISAIVQCGADLDQVDSDGLTSLAYAAHNLQRRMVQRLVDLARFEIAAKCGASVIHIIAWSGNREIWGKFQEYNQAGKLRGVDVDSLHLGHDIWQCFDICRKERYWGDEEDPERDREAFRSLLDTVRYVRKVQE